MPDATPVEALAGQFLDAIRERDGATARRLLAAHPDLESASIHAAAAAGRDDIVLRELTRDPGLVRAEHPRDRGTPLAYACGSPIASDPARAAGMLSVVRRLLDAGADAGRASMFSDGSNAPAPISALYYACINNNLPVARLLLERGAPTEDGEATYHAAQEGRLEALALLEEFGADFSAAQSPYGNTPLFFLAGHHDEDDGRASWLAGFRWLLEHGADPNVPSYTHREVPLHAVARSGHLPRATTLLLDHGADPNRGRADGVTPFALAVRRGIAATIDRLRTRGGDESNVTDIDRFVGACVAANEAEARRLAAAHPALVHDRALTDGQALRQAIRDNSTSSLRLMKSLGIEIDVTKPIEGATPLHEAAWAGRPDVVRLLLEWGAPVNVRDRTYGSSPIGWAAHGSRYNGRKADADYISAIDQLAAAGSTMAFATNSWGEEPVSLASDAVAAHLRAIGFVRR